MEIESNSMVVITPKMNILQIPIEYVRCGRQSMASFFHFKLISFRDEYSARNADGAEAEREVKFAEEKGLWNPNPRRKTRGNKSSGHAAPIPETSSHPTSTALVAEA